MVPPLPCKVTHQNFHEQSLLSTGWWEVARRTFHQKFPEQTSKQIAHDMNDVLAAAVTAAAVSAPVHWKFPKRTLKKQSAWETDATDVAVADVVVNVSVVAAPWEGAHRTFPGRRKKRRTALVKDDVAVAHVEAA